MLGFAATLGATVFAFQGIGASPACRSMLPIIVYLFVVALGTDYNILMIARLREEAPRGHELRSGRPRPSARRPVGRRGRAILAGTFAVADAGRGGLPGPDGAAVTVGIVLAAFVISVFLVPAVTALIGTRAWWPSRIDRGGGPAAPADRTGRRRRRDPAGRAGDRARPGPLPHLGSGPRWPVPATSSAGVP